VGEVEAADVDQADQNVGAVSVTTCVPEPSLLKRGCADTRRRDNGIGRRERLAEFDRGHPPPRSQRQRPFKRQLGGCQVAPDRGQGHPRRHARVVHITRRQLHEQADKRVCRLPESSAPADILHIGCRDWHRLLRPKRRNRLGSTFAHRNRGRMLGATNIHRGAPVCDHAQLRLQLVPIRRWPADAHDRRDFVLVSATSNAVSAAALDVFAAMAQSAPSGADCRGDGRRRLARGGRGAVTRSAALTARSLLDGVDTSRIPLALREIKAPDTPRKVAASVPRDVRSLRWVSPRGFGSSGRDSRASESVCSVRTKTRASTHAR
jgi:hypothetical protein